MSHLCSTPTQNLCSAFLTEWSHFRSKNTTIAPQAHRANSQPGALPALCLQGTEGKGSVYSQLSALLRGQAILFGTRVPLRLDRRFWPCLWAQQWL